ncbi:hypothetical protein NEMBOFW57_003983 [Staphylotrichum longicolle]|uniref:Protein kinase domain-containing protein n=1 Tax=Staphylotrichum longicolle TaxID=669026 RepID=A0AAD4F5L3_9PEZI|nr:hypothetical protein NEMBOFW57_003983 [Staphylotrichum longicolle]
MQLPPFFSEAPLQGDPPCSWDDFLNPQLRHFPREGSKVRLTKALGHGIEGVVARAKFEDDDTRYALKIFFDSIPTEDDWWPLEREARNVAVPEKVRTGLRQSSPQPIYVPANRTTRLDCLRCLFAFSAEGRQSRLFDALAPNDKVAISHSFTRLRNCFGWTRVRGADFICLNEIIEIDDYAAEKGEGSASYLEPDRDYFAIVYEYIPETKLELSAVQRQLDFFYHIGFQPCQGVKEKNWQGPGILLDFGDYNSPVDQWFRARRAHHPRPSAELVLDRPNVEARAAQEFDQELRLREQGIGPKKEAKQAQEKQQAIANTARAIERGYQGDQRYRSYFDLDQDEILELGLEEDPLATIHIPPVEPKALRRAWKTYNDLRNGYLAQALKNSGFES